MKNIITLLIVLISLTGNSQNFKPTDKFYQLDSTNLPYIESLIAERVNMYRKEKGLEPLIWNDTLKPMTDHHSYYMTHAHDMSHDQTVDLPNFEEIKCPFRRFNLNAVRYGGINGRGEVLTSDVFNIDDGMTFENYVTRQIEEGFMRSEAHWKALMDSEILVYMYVDVVNTNPDIDYSKIQYIGSTFTTIVMSSDIILPPMEEYGIVDKYKDNSYAMRYK